MSKKEVTILITSKQNSKFKYWMKLKIKKYRDEYRQFLVFGEHQIEKAKQSGLIEEMVTSNENVTGTLISIDLMKDLQLAETFFDTLAVCKFNDQKMKSSRVLFLDDIQDPDNLGALIRSAAAFGFHQVITSHKSADFYNEKTIRAAKGSIFDVELSRGPIVDYIKQYKALGFKIIGADAHGTKQHISYDQLGLVLGNEGHGLSSEVKALCDAFYTIDTMKVESLNVSVAGGILMHQWRVS